MGHFLEDIFSEIKSANLTLTTDIFNDLFRANDILGKLINGIKNNEQIPYKGLLTKLKIILQNASSQRDKTRVIPPEEETKAKDENKEEVVAILTPIVERINIALDELKRDIKNTKGIASLVQDVTLMITNAQTYRLSSILEISQVLHGIFVEIASGQFAVPPSIFKDLYRSGEVLKKLVYAIENDEKPAYKGLAVKLKIILRKAKQIQKSEPQQARTIQHTLTTNSIKEEEPVANLQSTPSLTFSDRVQVPISKLDTLLNLVGELAIEKDRIISDTERKSNSNEYARLYRITSDLQYSVMGVRLVQVSVLFQKFYRVIRDVAVLEDKKVNLTLEGTSIEIDRNVLQTISDSMVHLVRNAVSHGIETSEHRLQKGKPATGKIKLHASNNKDNVIIDIIDDGIGIDPNKIKQKALEKGILSKEYLSQLTDNEIIGLIFESGISSAEHVTKVSGRGVGMDVVKRSIESIGGKISIKTQVGKGTTFSMFLPSSMAVKSALLFVLNNANYAIPLAYTESVTSMTKNQIHKIGNGLMTIHHEQTILVVYLHDIFESQTLAAIYTPKALHKKFDTISSEKKLYLIVVAIDERQVGFVVDKVLQQKEIIEKPLIKPLENITFISGATILGNGNVCLVLDVPAITEYLFRKVHILPAYKQ